MNRRVRRREPRSSAPSFRHRTGCPALRTGVLLQIARAEMWGRASPPELRSDTEDRVDELALCYRIALGHPADLPFTDCVHRFVALDGSTCSLRGSEPEARRDSPLLMNRWSCSMMLFRYGAVRQQQRLPS